jgi:DNA-binding NtrC family response regulator
MDQERHFGSARPQINLTAAESERPLAVLVVDGEMQTRRHLVRALTDAGYSASGAQTVGDALALLLLDRFDAVVVDLELPGIPGMDLLGHVALQRPDIATLALTRIHDIKRARGARLLGVDNYLTKPLRSHQIVAGVAEAIVTRALKQRVRAS